MNHIALARTYRPKIMTDMVGQEHIVIPISKSLEVEKVHHAYLFSGTRGVGKTSLARILVKSLNCENGITPTPCLKCRNCISCDENSYIDFIELDAASHSKVEETRELLETAIYPPSISRKKIILLDEVHMLTKHSFNALLKTLEEPPPYLVFIFATTELEMIPETIRSRCLLFHFRPVPIDMIVSVLSKVLQNEKIDYTNESLIAIAEAANGSIRDSLNILETALFASDTGITLESVKTILGPSSQSLVQLFFQFVVNDSKSDFESAIKMIDTYSGEPLQILDTIIQELQQASLAPYSNQTNNTHYLIAEMLQKLQPHLLQVFMQIVLDTRKNYSYYPNGKSAVINSILRIALVNKSWGAKEYSNSSPFTTHSKITNNSHPVVEQIASLSTVTITEHQKRFK
ncbi:MAG: DNA polymerase III subunit gamma/tau [Methylacidiphilales bacterium]|nr:DNA polymerase III subunit gamma/tau [Candidatus Methylacidiphilales bacterium]